MDYDDNQGGGEISNVPSDLRNLRACMFCALVKTGDQFVDQGCDNCPFLEMVDDKGKVTDCTSPNFSGMISMMIPDESWVAKWQRIGKMKPGCYALSVVGRPPREIIRTVEQLGIPYVRRDGPAS